VPPVSGAQTEVSRFMAFSNGSVAGSRRPRVLCVDDDRSIGETVKAILADEGYDVTCLFENTDEALRQAIDELKPDCLLLDSSSRTDYGPSWAAAAWIHHLARSVPVVMFSAHLADSREAAANLTERSQDASFAAVLLKPFSIEQLVDAVSSAVDRRRLGEPADVGTQPLVISA
jgi:CheY-like chemotaxis protein